MSYPKTPSGYPAEYLQFFLQASLATQGEPLLVPALSAPAFPTRGQATYVIAQLNRLRSLLRKEGHPQAAQIETVTIRAVPDEGYPPRPPGMSNHDYSQLLALWPHRIAGSPRGDALILAAFHSAGLLAEAAPDGLDQLLADFATAAPEAHPPGQRADLPTGKKPLPPTKVPRP